MSALTTNNLSKSFGGVSALTKVSLGFRSGRVNALIGPNGAGKTTLFNTICGFSPPDSGSVFQNDKEITHLPYWEIARMGIGRLFQDIRLFPQMTVEENVLVAMDPGLSERVVQHLLFGSKEAQKARSNQERSRTLLEHLAILELREQRAGDLSYGQQKMVGIARLLAAQPEVLLLDEPATGLASSRIADVFGIFRSLAKQGRTIVVIEHDMAVIRDHADYVYFLDDGQLKTQGSVTEVLQSSEVSNAYMGV